MLYYNISIMELRIKELIKNKGLTMQEFANTLGIARVNLTKTINGNPTIETLQKIANALEVDFLELFDSSSKGELTALIDNKGQLYRAKSLGELERIISEIKAKKGE